MGNQISLSFVTAVTLVAIEIAILDQFPLTGILGRRGQVLDWSSEAREEVGHLARLTGLLRQGGRRHWLFSPVRRVLRVGTARWTLRETGRSRLHNPTRAHRMAATPRIAAIRAPRPSPCRTTGL